MDTFNTQYMGATCLVQDVETALAVLHNQLSTTVDVHATHSVLRIEGIESTECLEATAIYLAGSIAVAVEQNMNIRQALYGEGEIARDLSRDIENVIKYDNNITKEFRTKKRDPWLWEGISHLMVHLSRVEPGLHPPGYVLAKTTVKHDVNDHGLDLVGIYFGEVLGVIAGESKAYLKDPGRGIRDASNRLREVDLQRRDSELRSTVAQLRHSIPENVQDQVAGAFWHQERSYFPFICCDSAHAVDWSSGKRPSLNKLNVPVSKKLLLPLSITSANTVFDSICSLMRAYPLHVGEHV